MNVMKKLPMLFLPILLSLLSTIAIAQSSGKCYDESTHLINIGVGTGGFHGYQTYRNNVGANYSYGSTPVFSFSYEQPLKNKVGPGFIGVGAYLSFQNAHRYDDYDWWYNGTTSNYRNKENWNYYVVAARGAYHWDGLNSGKAEVYAGTIIGVRISTYDYSTDNKNPNYTYVHNHASSVTPAFSVYAGARYYFVPNVAFFGEVGAGVSFISGGLTFKF